MKTILYFLFILLSLTFLNAQEIYSLSGVDGKGIQFSSIDEIQSQKTLYNASEDLKSEQFSFVNASFDAPNSKLIAAMAYDAVSQNIIYMPMMSSSVYLKNTSNGTLLQLNDPKNISASTCNQGTQFSRMTMGADGNAYALSNDFQELIQINPKTKQINNLGSVAISGFDPIKNNKVWGGDMVADSQNQLYVISAMGNVFKIDINSLNSELLGSIKGLPQGFTTNGAAVLADGSIVVSNAKGEGLYQLSISDLNAKFYQSSAKPSYDLASRFVISISSDDSQEIIAQNGIQIYPTVIDQGELNVKPSKDYSKLTVRIYDTNAYLVDEFKIRSLNDQKAENLKLKLQPNIYIVKITDENGVEVLNQKVTVTR